MYWVETWHKCWGGYYTADHNNLYFNARNFLKQTSVTNFTFSISCPLELKNQQHSPSHSYMERFLLPAAMKCFIGCSLRAVWAHSTQQISFTSNPFKYSHQNKKYIYIFFFLVRIYFWLVHPEYHSLRNLTGYLVIRLSGITLPIYLD